MSEAGLQEEARTGEWEVIPCLGCSAAPEDGRVVARFEPGIYRQCRHCGLVYLSPRLAEADMLAIYRTGPYFGGDGPVGYEAYREDEPAYRRTFARRVDELAAFQPEGTLLDIGCGYGWLVDAALEKGFDAYGLEASEEAVGSRSDLGDRIQSGLVGSERLGSRRFDVISMMDVFEHLYEPSRQIDWLADHLNPGGILALATPDFDSWLRRLLGRRSVSFKVPEHVTYFSRESLDRVTSERFERIHTYQIGQYCTLPFLESRLSALWAPLAWPLHGARLALGKDWMPYVPSGSMFAILKLR